MALEKIPADKKIDPVRLDAWIHMNTVTNSHPSPGASFIYVRDLAPGVTDEIDPTTLQDLIEASVSSGDPRPGLPFIYIDDLMEGFRGSRLEPR